MKHSIAVSPAATEFSVRLAKLDTDVVNSLDCDFADLYFNDDEEPLKMSDLPRELPVSIRKHLVALAKEKRRIHDTMDDLVSVFQNITSAILAKKEADDEKRKPHCDKCGQVLKPKSKKRR